MTDGGTFPGSGGAASVVEWVDGLLVALNDGRVDEVREALDQEKWRTGVELPDIPGPILDQFIESIEQAAEALASGSADAAQEQLLIARSRFLPGA